MATQSSNPILNKAIAGANAAVATTSLPPVPTNEVLAATPLESKLAAVEAALGTQATMVGKFVSEEAGALKDTGTINDVMVASMIGAAEATQDIALVKNNADMKAQNSTIDAITALGGADAMVASMAQLDEEGQRLDDLLDKQTDIMNDEFTGIGLIDSVINGFRAISTQDQIASVTAERDNTARQLQLETAATESANRQAILSKQTITNATIKANSNLIAHSANQDIAKAKLEGIRSNSDRMRSLVNASQQQLANTVQAAELANQEQSMQLSRERMVVQREQLAAQREMIPTQKAAAETALANAKLQLAKSADLAPTEVAARELALQKSIRDMETVIAAEDSMAIQAQLGIAGMGLPEESIEQITVKLNNSATKAKYIKLQELGAAEKFRLADNPYDAQLTRGALDPQGLASDNRGYQLLDDVEHKVETEIAAIVARGGKAPKTPEAQKDLFNAVAEATMKGNAANITEGNPLHAAPLSVLVENYAEIGRTPLYQKVLGPAGANVSVTDAKQVRKLGINAVRAKLISTEEYVAGMETIFDAAVVYNNESEGGFSRVGLPNQTNYNVLLKSGPSLSEAFLDSGGINLGLGTSALARVALGRNEVVDLTDSASIKLDLTREMSALMITEPTDKTGTMTTGAADNEGKEGDK